MNKQGLIDALDALPDDVIIIFQVTAPDGSAWNMDASLSGVLDNFKWDRPVAALSLKHDNLTSLNPPTWKETS